MYADIFVAVDKRGRSRGKHRPNFVCGHCIPTHSPRIDVSRDSTDVWELHSDGWLSAPSCMDCGDEIPVTVGADRDCPECGAEGPHDPNEDQTSFCCTKCGACFDAY